LVSECIAPWSKYKSGRRRPKKWKKDDRLQRMVRDTFSADGPLSSRRKLLGHASVKTTERYAFARIPDILKMVKEII